MTRKFLRVGSIVLFGISMAAINSHADLVAHYTFDDADVDGVVIKDVSGNGLNGIKTNDGPLTSVPGKLGQAASFDGGSNGEENPFVDLSDHADAFANLFEGTLAAWIQPATADEAGGEDGHFTDVLTIFAASDSTQGSTEMRWAVHSATSPFNPVGPGGAEDGSMYLGVRGGEFSDHLITDVSDEINLLDGNWHHVAVTVDGDNFGNMFIDGAEVSYFSQSGEDEISFMGDLLPDGPDHVAIGRNLDSGGPQWFYQGLIDDLRVYNTALSTVEIQSLYELANTANSADFDGDGTLGIGDILLLQSEINVGNNDLRFDVNGDTIVDKGDVDFLVGHESNLNTYIGDANLDGEFNSGDLVEVFTAGEYEHAVEGNATWATGDWNSDGKFDSSDFVVAFTDGGYEVGPKNIAAVPEPSGVALGTIGCGVVLQHRRKSRHAKRTAR